MQTNVIKTDKFALNETNDLTVIQTHINNLINTYGEARVKELVKFILTEEKPAKKKKVSNQQLDLFIRIQIQIFDNRLNLDISLISHSFAIFRDFWRKNERFNRKNTKTSFLGYQ